MKAVYGTDNRQTSLNKNIFIFNLMKQLDH